MARLPRSLILADGSTLHKIWRSHDKEWNLSEWQDKERYTAFLNEDLETHFSEGAVKLHAACLMSNHCHECMQTEKQTELSHHMRRHHGRYGSYFNKKHERRGKVMLERPKTCMIYGEHREMRTVFYIHANPVRAGIVNDAKDYFWSTHRLYAFGQRESWMKYVSFPTWYLGLGDTPAARQKKYRKLFDAYLKREGLVKQTFLNKPFYGPSPWKAPFLKSLRAWRKAHAPPNVTPGTSV